MSPESDRPLNDIGQLCAQLDEETLVMSGGFERLEAFQKIVGYGEVALPDLLEYMEQPGWWRMQAIWTIAHHSGKPIEFPEEIRGKYTEVRNFMIDWARAYGYIPESPDN